MNYDIKILGENFDNTILEFDRLSKLIKSIKDIATKALMLKIRGLSDIAPNNLLKGALKMNLENIPEHHKDVTKLIIDCKNFSESLAGYQYNLFTPFENLSTLTPMALVIQSFQVALANDKQDADLDKPLLKSLLNFKKNFTSDNEVYYLSNRGSVPEVKLTKEDFNSISLLQDSIPEPHKVILNGFLDEMRISKGTLGLQTQQGIVTVIEGNDSLIPKMTAFMGKKVTIHGMVHYKPSGEAKFVAIQSFSEPDEKDKFFSQIPNAMTAKQQLILHGKHLKPSSSFEALKNISGLFDDIDDAQFKTVLKDLHR